MLIGGSAIGEGYIGPAIEVLEGNPSITLLNRRVLFLLSSSLII
jgi:hypothetical protein